jgi:hypothetical protein
LLSRRLEPVMDAFIPVFKSSEATALNYQISVF